VPPDPPLVVAPPVEPGVPAETPDPLVPDCSVPPVSTTCVGSEEHPMKAGAMSAQQTADLRTSIFARRCSVMVNISASAD